MDRSTKATLWIAFLVLFSYFGWFFVDCAIDDTCHLVCPPNASHRAGCYTQRTPDLKHPWRVRPPHGGMTSLLYRFLDRISYDDRLQQTEMSYHVFT